MKKFLIFKYNHQDIRKYLVKRIQTKILSKEKKTGVKIYINFSLSHFEIVIANNLNVL